MILKKLQYHLPPKKLAVETVTLTIELFSESGSLVGSVKDVIRPPSNPLIFIPDTKKQRDKAQWVIFKLFKKPFTNKSKEVLTKFREAKEPFERETGVTIPGKYIVAATWKFDIGYRPITFTEWMEHFAQLKKKPVVQPTTEAK